MLKACDLQSVDSIDIMSSEKDKKSKRKVAKLSSVEDDNEAKDAKGMPDYDVNVQLNILRIVKKISKQM